MCVLTTQRMSVVISLYPGCYEYYDMVFLVSCEQVLRQICSDEKQPALKNHNSCEYGELKSVSVTKSPSVAFLNMEYIQVIKSEKLFQLFSSMCYYLQLQV